MHLAVNCKLGSLFLDYRGGIAHEVDGSALAGALGGVGQHGDLRVHAEDLCGLCSLDGDLGELIGSGENDVALLVELVLIGDVYGAVAHLDEHGAEVVALGERGARVLCGDLAAAQLDHLLDHRVHFGIGQRIDYLKTLDIEAALCSRCLDLIDVADENRSQEAVLLEPCCGLENARIAALGIDNLAGIGFKYLSDFQTWLIPPECLFLHTNTVPLLAAVFKIFAAISIYKGIFYLYNILTVINF